MRKIILLVLIMLGLHLPVLSANVIPYEIIQSDIYTLGVYQAPKKIQIFSSPDLKSDLLFELDWQEEISTNTTLSDIFLVCIAKKNLAFLTVTDENEEWVEVLYNKSEKKKGWLKKDDPYRFLTWINFYNNYGKKYGLTLLKGAPKSCLDIKASMEANAKTIATINNPEMIKLNVIRGNWALVSVFDIDRTPKTGYVRWRSDDGVRYFYPSVK